MENEKIERISNKDDENTEKTLSHYNMDRYKDIQLDELLSMYNTRDYNIIVKAIK